MQNKVSLGRSPTINVTLYCTKGSVGGPKYLKRQQRFSLTSQRKGFECAHSQNILILLNIQDIQNIKFSGSTILMEFQAPATMSTSQVR